MAVSNSTFDGASVGADISDLTISLPNNQDWVFMFWINWRSAIGSGGFGITFEFAKAGPSRYIDLGQNNGKMYLEGWNGTDNPVSEAPAGVTNNKWWHYVLRKVGNVYSAYVSDEEGATKDLEAGSTVTIDLSGETWTTLSWQGADDRVTSLKGWLGSMTDAEIRIERERYGTCKSNAWINIKAQVHTDLTDYSGNGRHMSSTGTLVTYTGPTIADLSCSIAMPATGSLIDHSEPCCDALPGSSMAGPVLPFVSPLWEQTCDGGGTVPMAAEIVDDEDWTDTTPPKEPDSWLTIETSPYPAVSPTDADTLHWGLKPLSDPGRFVEARLIEVGEIERNSSDKDGRYAPARLRVVADDADGTFRTLLGDSRTRFLLQREARYEVSSYAGRKAALDPLPQFHGRIVDVQPALDRRAVIEVQDVVGSQFGLLNPEKLIGLLIGDEHEALPDDTRGHIYNILLGEHSDRGAVDAAGNSVMKGVIPARDCGDSDFESSPSSSITYVSPPRNLTATLIGAGSGSRTYYYGIVGLTEFGHTLMSNIASVSGCPDSLDVDTYVELDWDPPLSGSGFVIAYWVLGRTASTPNKRLDTMNNGGTFVNPETTYRDGRQGSRTDFDSEKPVNFKPIATAVASHAVWTWFAVAIGEVQILDVCGSDLATTGVPKRVVLDIDAGDILTPASADWPEPDPYRVVGGIRQTGFWARGPRVQHHRDGIVTFACNVCGLKGANGEVINQAYLMLQTVLNEFVEKDDGLGYRDGAFGPIETFANGTPKFWTSKFQEAQDVTAAWVGGSPSPSLGYIGAIAITEQTALAEFLRRFFTTFGGYLTSDGHGRIYPYVIDPEPVAGTGRLFRERMEISRLLDHQLAWNEVENRITYAYHYDADGQQFRSVNNVVENPSSIAAHGGDQVGVFTTTVKECYYGNDAATMADRWQRHLDLYSYAPRYVVWATNAEHLQLVNGDPVRFSHRKEGVGVLGETATAGTIIQTRVMFQPQLEVQHTVRLLESGSP